MDTLLIKVEQAGGACHTGYRTCFFRKITDKFKKLEIIEKPVQKFFVNAGIYVINPALYRTVSGSDFLDMPDLLQKCIDKGNQVNMFPVHEYWMDIGRMDDYLRARNERRTG